MVIEVADHGLVLMDVWTFHLKGTLALSSLGSMPYGIIARAGHVGLTPRLHRQLSLLFESF